MRNRRAAAHRNGGHAAWAHVFSMSGFAIRFSCIEPVGRPRGWEAIRAAPDRLCVWAGVSCVAAGWARQWAPLEMADVAILNAHRVHEQVRRDNRRDVDIPEFRPIHYIYLKYVYTIYDTRARRATREKTRIYNRILP